MIEKKNQGSRPARLGAGRRRTPEEIVTEVQRILAEGERDPSLLAQHMGWKSIRAGERYFHHAYQRLLRAQAVVHGRRARDLMPKPAIITISE